MNNATVLGGGASLGLNHPSGMDVFGTDADSIIVSDSNNDRVLALWNINTIRQNMSVIATEWAPGQSLNDPRDLYVDVRNTTDLYVCEGGSGLIVLYSDIQNSNRSTPRVVAGTNNSSAPGFQRLFDPNGVRVTKNYHIFATSLGNHRINYWLKNATIGVAFAGLGAPGNTSTGLHRPNGIEFDESNGWLYVADAYNNRIQRFSLNDTLPRVGTTVAGGNGPGNGSHQLFNPVDIRLSKKTGAIYIADYNNNRIQRWQPGATQGVTIAGSLTGSPGSGATRLRDPVVLALNTNETYMYVADRGNHRIQQFQLI